MVAASTVARQLGHVHVAVRRGGRWAEGGHAGGRWGRARVAGVQQVWRGRRRRGGAVHIPLVRIFEYVINKEGGGDIFLVVNIRYVLREVMLRHRGADRVQSWAAFTSSGDTSTLGNQFF